MKTKVLALVLAMLMLLSLAACNSGNDNGDQNTDANATNTTAPADGGEETSDPDKTEETTDAADAWGAHLPQKTYNNEEFVVMFRNNLRYVNAIMIDQITAQSTSVERAVYQRMASIEETYKVKFDYQLANDDNSQMMTTLSGYSKTGTDQIDLFGAHAMNIPWTLAINGCLYEWGDLDLIDLDAPYWNQNAKENFSTPGGKIFFITGDMIYLTVATAFCMFFNEDIITNINGLDLPYDLVRNDEWTFEEFQRYVLTTSDNMDGDGS
ncbi:MAG: hypothetical protein IJX62_04355, partial [Clostridia bacterium]|nr:hypothetical protein [Clostridia bacterium]